MLYRNNNGKLVEINRYSYVNDKEYYESIIRIKYLELNKKKINQTSVIDNIINKL